MLTRQIFDQHKQQVDILLEEGWGAIFDQDKPIIGDVDCIYDVLTALVLGYIGCRAGHVYNNREEVLGAIKVQMTLSSQFGQVLSRVKHLG